MKILAIRGRNLASLDGFFELDFTCEPLLTAGIFAISGPTGAGKSTLLDAMCLALFAKTPRTEQAKENSVRVKDLNDDALTQSDPRFLLRRGTASGYAEVDFFALNGFRYRSRWFVMRAREREDGRLQQFKITLFNLDKDKEEQGTRSEIQNRIVELIGLTFEQFTRSVLLAQNDFSTFLKAEQGEKASLLEKLTGTELYSNISRLIFTRNSEAKEAYEAVLRSLQGIELLPEEEVTQIQVQLKELEQTILLLEKKKGERQALEKAVKSAEELITSRQLQQKDIGEKLQTTSISLTKSKEDYEKCYLEQQSIQKEFQQIQPELQAARLLDAQIETELGSVTDAEKNRNKIAGEKKETEDKLNQTLELLKKSKEEWDYVTGWFQKYSEKEQIAEKIEILLMHLDAAAQAYASAEQFKSQQESCRKQLTQLGEKAKQCSGGIQKQKEDFENKSKELLCVEEQLSHIKPEEIQKNIVDLQKERETLLIEQARFVTTGDIQTMRENLTEGQPCPVCGSIHHPYVSVEAGRRIDTLTQRISTITIQLKELAATEQNYKLLQSTRNELQQKQIHLQRILSVTEKELTEIQHQIQLQQRQSDLYEKQRQEQLRIIETKLAETDSLFGHTQWKENWNLDPSQFRKSLIKFSREWREKKERLQELDKQKIRLQSEQDSFQRLYSIHLSTFKEAEISYTHKKELLDNKRKERLALLQGKRVEVVEIFYQNNLKMAARQLEDLQKIQSEQSIVVEQLKGQSNQLEQDMNQIKKELESHTKALIVWYEQYNQTSPDGISVENAIAENLRRKTEMEFRLRTNEENKKKATIWQEELEARRQTSDKWSKLNELAGSADGAKFRRIAQAYTLDILLTYTNMQLKNLTNRYRLERVPGTLALQVIDKDMCDEVRTVHSLSGGESFLVSLALALGLSSLSSNRMKVESLFIDEGFGSLDSDTLRIAMDALESLHTQGRKIGVISHVQEMTERIPVQVAVCRANNGRSFIKIN